MVITLGLEVMTAGNVLGGVHQQVDLLQHQPVNFIAAFRHAANHH